MMNLLILSKIRVLFLSSSEAEFVSPLYVHIALATDTEAKS